MVRVVALAADALLTLSAAAQDLPGRLALPALRAEPDPAGGRIVDTAGREVLLRGVNVNAGGAFLD